MPQVSEIYQRSHESALVVFTGETDLAYLKCLKPGFRHCFVILRGGDKWISIDPLAHMTRIQLHDDLQGRDVEQLLGEHGLTVVNTHLREAAPKLAPPMMCTCVEMVKRILGIHAWHVWTPWQLYRHLLRL